MIPLLTTKPGRMGGAVTIRGTRLTLAALRSYIAQHGCRAAVEAYPALTLRDAETLAACAPKWPGRVSAMWGPPGDESSPYRLLLTCTWEPRRPPLAVMGLNPSTASPDAGPDATCRRWLAMAIKWGFGGLIIGNLDPLRATSQKDLRAGRFAIKGHEPVLVSEHDRIAENVKARVAMASAFDAAPMVLACWGAGAGHTVANHLIGSHRALFAEKLAYLHSTSEGFPAHVLVREKGVIVSELRPRAWFSGAFVDLPIDEEVPHG